MTTVYLFQVDSAKENRPFFEGIRDASPDSVYFRGLDFNVGPWTPDGVRVDLELDPSQPRRSLVLIELEATEPTALRSSRKYLNESSTEICGEFVRYLGRVIKDCDAKADPREEKITLLKIALAQSVPVVVKTAAALRSSTTFLEESTLIDLASLAGSNQPPQRYVSDEAPNGHTSTEKRIARKRPTFRDVCKLDAEQSQALRRCILILDSVVRQTDHSNAVYRDWKIRPPLKRLLWKFVERPPALDQFILKQGGSGTRVDIEPLLSELVKIWAKSGRQIGPEDVRKLIDDYFSTAMEIKPHDEMHLIFEEANSQVGKLLENLPQ